MSIKNHVKKIQRELTCPMCHSKWEQTFITVTLSLLIPKKERNPNDVVEWKYNY